MASARLFLPLSECLWLLAPLLLSFSSSIVRGGVTASNIDRGSRSCSAYSLKRPLHSLSTSGWYAEDQRPPTPFRPTLLLLQELSSGRSWSSTSRAIIIDSLRITIEDSPALQRAVREQAAGITVARADGYELSFRGWGGLPVIILAPAVYETPGIYGAGVPCARTNGYKLA